MNPILRRIGVIAALATALVLMTAAPALACSPPFNPTIEALGPDAVVLVGTTGQPAAGGRLFHVERAWNGDIETTPIVIAFKEGEPVGDCSYPVAAGTRLIIAPNKEPDGTLSADLGTLQADPVTPDGRRYTAEAIDLFGPGFVPMSTEDPAVGDEEGGMPDVFWLALAAVLVVGVGVPVLVVLMRRTREPPPG